MRRRALLLALGLALLIPVVRTAADDEPASDPRVGTVLATQGRALVRPLGHRRWTPLAEDALLLPGDAVKTGTRGAHACEIALAPAGTLLLGPGALAELPERGRVRLLRGDAEVRGEADAAVAVTGPGDFAREVRGTARLAVRSGATTLLDEAPRWLTGYRTSTRDEWMGSLLANVDGRNVPLAVGYHKVTVDVRDQIARTTVEQSFVNSTDARLEGVFYFPLPADASISGFAMWIGNELVEADVVEKARARQIYEDILRRKKDPGLLEWEGGNLFKARVYPIEPHSEKRVRLRYTQVLRLEGDTWRYRYALRSDLLRSKPLRRLDVEVNVLSTQRMTKVVCPTHACQITTSAAGTEARVLFDAEEYVPTKDLEVGVTLEASPGITPVAYRSGDEGTFMLLLAPPEGGTAGWKRELMPEGDPLDVLVVADTSGSMDAAAREAQASFVDALLDLLGEQDRFRLCAADVEVHWAFDGARPVDDATRAAARAFLAGRVSLGWTDLEKTLGAALAAAGEKTLVLYLGDGIPTTDDADPVATADRLRALLKAHPAPVHAVSVSSTYEQGVLEALASTGGSVRRAEPGAAYALLADAARPLLKDARVVVEGVPTARVYPETLPNLPLGHQQVVLGRFLPREGAREAQVVVTGELEGRPVRYASSFTLPAADAGNSFLPRLWARRHLDALLAQGPSQAVQDEIVSFSAEYGILTPYTSLLVLESDADRERYGIERTVKMRDGEAFFAAGRDKVALEMAREQARKAHAWRVGLRRRVLQEIAGLGRDLIADRPLAGFVALGEVANAHFGYAGEGDSGLDLRLLDFAPAEINLVPSDFTPPGVREPLIRDEELADHVETDDDVSFEESLGSPMESASPIFGERPPSLRGDVAEDSLDADAYGGLRRGKGAGRPAAKAGGWRYGGGYGEPPEGSYDAPLPGGWTVGTLGFPEIGVPLAARRPHPLPAWDGEVLDLLRRLDRRAALGALAGGVRVVRHAVRPHPARSGDVLEASTETALAGGARFFTGGEDDDGSSWAAWSDGERRARVDRMRGLGRRRPAALRDREEVPRVLGAFDLADFLDRYERRRVRVESRQRGRVTLRIEAQDLDGPDVLLVVDPERRVVTSRRTEVRGRVVARAEERGFVQVGGLWWPRLTQTYDARGRLVAFTTREVSLLDAQAFAEAFRDATASASGILFLDGRLPDVEHARRDAATFADHLTLALFEAGRACWDEALAAWARARALAGGKRGADWVHLAFLARARRGADLLAHVEAMAAAAGDEAEVLYGVTSSSLGARERLDLLRRLESAWRGGSEQAALRFERTLASALDDAGLRAEARALRARLADDHRLDVDAVRARASDLTGLGAYDDARALLERALATSGDDPFTREERTTLFQDLADVLWRARAFPDLDALLERWTEEVPSSAEAWRRLVSRRYLRGDVEGADGWVLDRLAAPVPDDPDGEAHARLDAAVTLALGSGWGFSMQGVQEAFVPVLADLARRAACNPIPDADLLARIRDTWAFRRTDGARLLREGLRADLTAGDGPGAMPVRRLAVYVASLPWERNAVAPDAFAALVDALATRWRGMEAGRERDALADLRVRLLDAHGDRPEAAGVLRERLGTETGFRRAATAALLYDRLLALDHEPAREDEALALAGDLLDPLAPEEHATVAALGARRLAAWAFEGRRKRALGPVEGLSRAEAREAGRRAVARARRGLVARLRAVAAPEAWSPWLEVERLGYAVELGEDPPSVAAAAYELLDTIPRGTEEPLERVLAERCVLVLEHAALPPRAPAGAGEALLAFLEGRAQDALDERLDWRTQIFLLLVALDRVDALQARLETWRRDDPERTSWPIVLAQVVAEQGRLEDAARLLEPLADADRLSPALYETLAAWDLAVGDDAARERALEGADRNRSEYELAARVRGAARRASDLADPETLRALRWLLRKASQPDDHLWWLQRLYENVRDPRLLASLAEGLPGHTPEGLYAFLRCAGELLANVWEEATVDEAMRRIDALAAGPLSPRDRRGLLLLGALLETRAALAAKADPAHAERAVAAYRALDAGGAWAANERRLLADVVAATAPVKHAALARERTALVRRLLAAEDADSPWRLSLTDALARILWAQDARREAVDLLGAALAAQEPLPPEAWPFFDRWIDWQVALSHFRDAESALLARIAAAENAHRAETLRLRLFRLYGEALAGGGALSIGRGAGLFAAGAAAMDAWLEHGEEAVETCGHIAALYEAANKTHAVADAPARYETWARERLPAHFARFPLERTYLARGAAQSIAHLVGPRAALGYALDAMDAEPPFFERIGLDLWSQADYDLARWRKDARDLGDLAPRLLARVVPSLEEHLRGGDRTGPAFWEHGHGTFWREQEDAFAAAAQRVVELAPDDVTLVSRAADYLRRLGRKQEAVGVLLAARARERLDTGGLKTLATWLVQDARHAEALDALEPLLESLPDDLDVHLLEASALYGAHRGEEALAALKAAAARFEERGRLTPQVAQRLGEKALDVERPAAAEAWLEQAAALRVAARGGRGGADPFLGRVYGLLAGARVRLGHTDAAVDAASAAIVAWGRSAKQRAEALAALEGVLEATSDLDAWVARYEAQVAETGLDAPVLRKALAAVATKRGDHAAALHHLLAARDLAPEDAEIHQRLVATYDALDDADGALAALLASLAQAPRNLDAASDLARRYAAAGRDEEAERARTNLVEPLPHEAAGHRRLATLREERKEDGAALVQWRQVTRTDPLDPTGWLSLARCQIRLGQGDEARATLERVLRTTWESRFGDVLGEATKLLNSTQAGR